MIDRTKFFAGHRHNFGSLSQGQVDGLNFLLSEFEQDTRYWRDLRHIAYALATIRRETGISRVINGVEVSLMYQPIEEKGSKVYLSKYFLSPRLKRALGNIQLSDAWNYKGRGYVQITGRSNYARFERLLGIPLLSQPELALLPDTAFRIMTLGMHGGLFTGVGLGKYINARETSYYYARKIINALDHAGEIAHDAVILETILRESHYEVVTRVVTPVI